MSQVTVDPVPVGVRSGPRRFTNAGLELARAHPIWMGAALGLTWGVAMRVWMRFISTNPEFSVSGTGAILVVTTVAGALLGLARLRRRRDGVGWWRLSLLWLLTLAAAGSLMWPTVVAWGIAYARRHRQWPAVLLLLAGAAAQAPVIDREMLSNWSLSTSEAIWAAVFYVPMLAIQAWAFSVVYTPGLAASPAPRWKKALIAAPVIMVSVIGVAAVGLQG